MEIVVLNECFLTQIQIDKLSKDNNVTVYEVTDNEDDVKERIEHAEVIFVDQFVCSLSNEVLDSAKNLKLILINSTAYHLVDLDYINSRNIAVCNTPNFCSHSVGELIFWYILSLARNTLQANKDNMNNPFEILPDVMEHRKYVGLNLNEKTIGILGLGNIGKKVSQIANGFNMRILGYNRSKKDIEGVEQVELDNLLSQSDIIVLTLPNSEETDDLLNNENLNLLKKNRL